MRNYKGNSDDKNSSVKASDHTQDKGSRGGCEMRDKHPTREESRTRPEEGHL